MPDSVRSVATTVPILPLIIESDGRNGIVVYCGLCKNIIDEPRSRSQTLYASLIDLVDTAAVHVGDYHA